MELFAVSTIGGFSLQTPVKSGIYVLQSADGRTRTGTGGESQRILSPVRLPFRHIGMGFRGPQFEGDGRRSQ